MDASKKKVPGRARGGIAVAAKLTPEQKAARARKAAAARWGYKAIRRGNFKKDFGIDVDCYVIDDVNKTAVISQIGMGAALGLAPRGNALPRFIGGKVMSGYVGAHIIEKIQNPLKFQWDPGGAHPPVEVHGYDVTLLVDICRAIIQAEADGKLQKQQEHVAKSARIILSASAKAGIKSLVYALAGYDQTKEEVIEAYKMYVREEAREYEREFTPELYEQWYRLYGLHKPVRGRPWEFRYLTIDHIYKPLAKSAGKVFELAKLNKANHGEANDKIHQFLSEIGVKALRTQIGKITGIAIVSNTREEYERHIAEKVFGQSSLKFD